jgi:hypothetical protein
LPTQTPDDTGRNAVKPDFGTLHPAYGDDHPPAP